MQKESRLLRKKERQTLRNIIIWVVILIIVVVLFFMYGIQMIINLSLKLEKSNADKTTRANNTAYIAPPMINPMPEATNSAKIIISGTSLSNDTVKLYVNDHLVESKDVSNNNSFSFQEVQLHDGENDIKAKAITPDGKESDYSETTKITYSNKAPKLDLDSPHDGQTFSGGDNPIKVSGTTDPGATVKINDYWAIVDDQGKFSYILPLQKGDTQLHIVASDQAGNQTTKDIKVTLNQ